LHPAFKNCAEDGPHSINDETKQVVLVIVVVDTVVVDEVMVEAVVDDVVMVVVAVVVDVYDSVVVVVAPHRSNRTWLKSYSIALIAMASVTNSLYVNVVVPEVSGFSPISCAAVAPAAFL
jgi:hypothetical protein